MTRLPALALKTSLSLLLLARPAAAETQFTLFGGYEAGGGFGIDSDLVGQKSDLKGAASFGASAAFRLGRGTLLEVLYARSETSLLEPAPIFGDDDTLFDLAVNHFHGGLEWEFGEDDAIRPFVEGLIGASLLDPGDLVLSSEWFFSGSVGGGVKLFFSPHLGVKLKARYVPIVVQSDEETFCSSLGGCVTTFNQDYISRAEVSAGLTFRW